MGKSYRKPYSAITGHASAKSDKRRAARGVRRKLNQWLKAARDFQDDLIPHRLECSWNQVWSWQRDGKQHYYPPSQYALSDWHSKLTRK
jgi:hypothetical protein